MRRGAKSMARACCNTLALFVSLTLLHVGAACADTMPSLLQSFAGNISYVGTQKSLRTQPNGTNACSVVANSNTAAGSNATTAVVAGIPVGATITAAYLYWAGSGSTPDYAVTFEASAITASRQYTSSSVGYDFFSGVADVTAAVAAKGNGTYTFSGLTIDTSATYCSVEAVLGGWALLVIYSDPSEEFRVLNLYEGFQYFQNSSITLNLSNFQIPASFTKGKHAHITWEGDPTLSGGGETLSFNGTTLSDGSNPVGNQFNSVSNSNGDATSYGVDFDVYELQSPIIQAGQTSATTVYTSGPDLVLLSAEIIAVPNIPATDLGISKVRNTDLVPGQSASYTLTVTNNGPLADTGPITVTDTLPAGLSYSSVSGAGWSCSAVGQVVTCTRSGSLANGASTSFTMTVAVAVGTSGTKTNTATVDGAYFDYVAGNNSASDTYVILPTAYAYYAMDETTWGTVTDTSGNSNGSVIGGAAPTGYPPATPPGAAIAGNPGTCGSGIIPAGAGVSTGIDVNADVGNTGTIAFWYKGTAAWSDGNDRMLLDASNELGAGGADKHFYLVKRGDGRLMFSVEDSGDTNSTATSGVLGYAANTWHYIAVTWSMSTDRLYIYVDGVQVASSTTNLNGTLGNTNTLYLGARRFSTVSGTAGNYTANSADGYLDEVRVYGTALNAAEITQLMNTTHLCAPIAPDHIRIEHDGSAISCNPESVVVKACANAACSTLYTGGVSGEITGNGVSIAPFTIPNGQSQVTVSLHVPTDTALPDPQTVRFGTTALSVAPTDASSPYCSNNGGPVNNTTACDISAAKAGLVFNVPNLVSGIASGSVTIAAVNSTSNTQCTPLFQNVTRSVNLWGTYQNPATGTLPLKINGGNIETIGSAGTPAYTSSFNLAFDASGVATLTSVQYDDVGLMQLNARYVGDKNNTPPDGGMFVRGSDSFIVRPHRFELSGIKCTTINAANCGPGSMALATPGDNPSGASMATNALGLSFIRAGHPFTVTVTARNAAGNPTLNFGKETPAQGVVLTPALVPGIGLTNNVAVGGGFGVFNNGVATGTDFTWQEVGIITLAPRVTPIGLPTSTYLSTGGDVGTTGDIASGTNTLTVASAAGAGITVGSYVTLIHPSGLNSHFTSAVTAVSGNTITLATAAPAAFTNATVYLSSAHVGRFYPFAFTKVNDSPSLINRFDVCPLGTETGCPSTFTYGNEQLVTKFTLTAKAYDGGAGVITQNYSWSSIPSNNFAYLIPTTPPGAGLSGPMSVGAVNVGTTRTIFTICGVITDATPCFMPSTASGTFTNGAASITLPLTVHRPNTPISPYNNLRFGIAPQDSDGVILKDAVNLGNLSLTGYDMDTVNVIEDTANFNHAFVGNTVVRWGRLWISNAHGSELLPLPVQVRAQFWNGSSFVTNTDDIKTSFANTAITPSLYKQNLTVVTFSTTPTIAFTGPAPAGGVSRFVIDAPGVGKTGSVNLDVTAIPYLPTQFSGRASFGLYKGNNNFIYFRENF